jgi:hypothetical protein
MSQTPGTAAREADAISNLERLAEECRQPDEASGTALTARVDPLTRPFPTLVVAADGRPLNVFAGRRFYWLGSTFEYVLGSVAAPDLAAAKLRAILTPYAVSCAPVRDLPVTRRWPHGRTPKRHP